VGTEPEETGTYKIPALLVLSEIASSLSTDATVDELLARYLSTMARIAGAHAGAVRVLTPEGRHMRLVSSVGMPPSVVERERLVPIGCGVCGEALCGDRAVLGEVPEQCRAVMPELLQELGGELVTVPLRHRDAVLGVYNLFLRAGSRLPDEVRILFGAISEHLGMALENARLASENARINLVNERQMLANQVHDSLAQTLAYAKMRTAALRNAQEAGEPGRAARYADEIADAIDGAYGELRELIGRFRQPMDPRGLTAALSASLDAYAKRSGAQVSFEPRAADLGLTPEEEMHVFHIVQEALANASKHASASAVRLSLERIDDSCRVCIEDDGVGMQAGPGEGHYGIAIMQERARRLGGEMLIESRPGAGVRLCLSFPARRAHEPHGSD
jgi:two-component system nitrate/nitrite sensor histidine kinase NarX